MQGNENACATNQFLQWSTISQFQSQKYIKIERISHHLNVQQKITTAINHEEQIVYTNKGKTKKKSTITQKIEICSSIGLKK